MKVLHFINSLSAGGAERLLVDLVLRLNKKGIKTDILMIKGGDSPFLEKLSSDMDIKVMELTGKGSVYNPSHILKLNAYFNLYDVVHVHLFPALYWSGIFNFFKKKNFHLVFTEHNTTNRRREISLFKFFDKLIYGRYDRIITISNSVDETLKSHLVNHHSKIVKIYNGIDLDEIAVAKPYGKNEIGCKESDVLIMQVSSFTPQKDQSTLIKSLQHLPDQFKLVLVGGGPLKAENLDYVKKQDLSERVIFLGIRNDVPRLLKTVDVVVLSSLFEGLSLASVEGLASGKPFISSNVPGLTEVVENAGLMFQSKNHKELAQLIQSLIDNREFYMKTVAKCQERAKMYDIRFMTNNYIRLYKELSFKKKKL
ncbi:glycosyltransferase [Croceitalea rosinachiae]|uniref:Glycosyltransferase n=1 Tax=Croceitalea rosinachiae TaxID=3075596 RepID=A0ABU3ACD0_9FLAO|nr:glycosyltransferase [Croceitalea sp. F388]MDT0607837.1 glycosyltransferase [Croceitalea sp. F388]